MSITAHFRKIRSTFAALIGTVLALSVNDARASTMDLPKNATDGVISAARQLESNIKNTVWEFECDAKPGAKVKIGFDSPGNIVLHEGYVGYKWSVSGSNQVKFQAPNGEVVLFMFAPDRSSFKFTSWEGFSCVGNPK